MITFGYGAKFCTRYFNLKYFYPYYNLRNRFLSSTEKSISEQVKANESKWESVVGLEIHAQINAKAKLFSSSSATFGSPTNTQVSYFDAALPGTMPVLNRYCVEAGILTALALDCTINKVSMFDRKHYFYPDLPAGYQITQYFHPLAVNGHIDFIVHDSLRGIEPYACSSKLKQLQLEQDSGKSFHVKGGKSLVDLNRAGVGLMELVFEPDLKNGEEAAALVRELHLILMRLGTCSGEMEEGALRVDANISVNIKGEEFGVRTEVKNINSLRYIAKAIDYEIERQIQVLDAGGMIANETRAFDYKTKRTIFMRDKEEFQDYRFMPEPDLPPLQLCDDDDVDALRQNPNVLNIDRLKERLPELPLTQRQNLINKYRISYDSADKLVKLDGLMEIFLSIASSNCDHDFICMFLMNNVQHQLNVRKLAYKNCPVSAEQLKELATLICNKTISEATGNDILEMLFNGEQRSAKQIVKDYNWFLIHKEEELRELCLTAMATRPKMAKKYRRSKKQRYMTSLLAELNLKANNRASIKDAEAVFVKLIFDDEIIKKI